MKYTILYIFNIVGKCYLIIFISRVISSTNVLNKYLFEVQYGFKEILSAYHGITLLKCASYYNKATGNHTLTD